MNKFLKILTLAGLTTALSITGLSLTNLKLKTNYKMNTEVDTESSDYVGKKTENEDATLSLTENAETNIEVHEDTMDEHNNPILDSANINPSSDENQDSNTPKTLEETEENLPAINEDGDTVIDTDNSANIEIEDDTLVKNNSDKTVEEDESTENNDEITDENTDNTTEQSQIFMSEEEYNSIITSYNELKEGLEELIKDSEKLAENSKNNQNSLTEEQKLNIQNKTEEINTLIMNVKENIKDLTCCLTGECGEMDNELKSYYFNEILRLNNKVNMLQSAMNMFSNPTLRFYQSPYSNLYGFSYYYSPNQISNEQNENDENNDSETEESVNKTFNLPNNLDTYGPTRRNIDTFFNTALLDENGIYNNMNPYGYMPYNNFGYGMNGYGNFNNSNYLNKNAVEENQPVNNTPLSVENSDQLTDPVLPEEIGKKRPKFAKNIDTYTGKTLDGNVNSMTGMKITDYLKQKFNKWFNKKESQQEVNDYVDNFVENHSKVDEVENSQTAKIDNELVSKDKQKNYW